MMKLTGTNFIGAGIMPTSLGDFSLLPTKTRKKKSMSKQHAPAGIRTPAHH
jgi:hypothetical protein